jgi:hypothetical protein
MKRSDFDSNREVVIETAQPSSADVRAVADPLLVHPERVGPEYWRARVALPQAGYLLQREAWYPGWHARVDGDPVAVLRADSLFRAIPLPAGEHEVEIFFDSASFTRGTLLSLGGLVIVVIMLSWRWLPIMRTSVQG